MADGIVQVPVDGTGKKIDTASLDVGANTVYRQRIVIGDNSASAQFATVTGGALLVTGTINVSAMPSVAVTGNFSATSTVVIAAGTANIGDINAISRTVQVAIGTPFTLNNISATVQVAISTPFILNSISATVNTATRISGFTDPSGDTRNVVDSTNLALRVNIVAGAAAGVSQVDGTTFSTQAANFVPIGGIFDDASPNTLSENDAGVCRVTTNRALHVNIRKQDGTEIDLSSTPSVVLAVGTNNFGTLNNISATVNVALATTVNVALATSFVVAVPSASHGPKTVLISTSAVVVLVANPGDGRSVYITQLMCTNAGTVNSLARVGTSASPSVVLGYMQSAGGGFVAKFDPPWKLSASATAIASVKPNSGGDVYFCVNFYTAP